MCKKYWKNVATRACWCVRKQAKATSAKQPKALKDAGPIRGPHTDQNLKVVLIRPPVLSLVLVPWPSIQKNAGVTEMLSVTWNL